MTATEITQPRNGIQTDTERISLFLKANKEKLISICLVAFFAIAALVAGGVLFHLKVNMTEAWHMLFVGGGGLALSIPLTLLIDYVRRQTHEDIIALNPQANNIGEAPNTSEVKNDGQQISYHIGSWKLATQEEYAKICYIRNQMEDGKLYKNAQKVAQKETQQENFKYTITDSDRILRTTCLRESFQQFKNLDIICLQETGLISDEGWKSLLPEGYSYFSNKGLNNSTATTIVWNSAKFTKLNSTEIENQPEHDLTNFVHNTVMVLEDNKNKVKICVGSLLAHNLLQRMHVFNRMNGANADLCVCAGDMEPESTKIHVLLCQEGQKVKTKSSALLNTEHGKYNKRISNHDPVSTEVMLIRA